MASGSSTLDQVAKRLHATPAQVTLAWLMARPTVTAPIASATSLAQLKELIGATKLKIDDPAMELLNRASDWRKPQRIIRKREFVTPLMVHQ